jgi:hypothetical protein
MQLKIDLKQLNNTEQELYKKLGKSCFFFLAPNSIDTSFPGPFRNSLDKMNKKLRGKLADFSKKQENQTLLNTYLTQLLQYSKEFPMPALLELEKKNINKQVLDFLYAQHILQQIRWREVLPELALYSMEMFIPPLTEEEKLGQKDEDFDLQQTLNVEMPFALMTDENGFFDLKLTKEREETYHLIKSRMSLVPSIETRATFLTRKLAKFPKHPFLGLNYEFEIQQMARILMQIVYDTQMAFIYEQLEDGVPLSEAKNNGQGFLLSFVAQKTLEELIVFRHRREEPLDLYVINLLNEMRQLHPEIKGETMQTFYGHIFNSLALFIQEKRLIPGGFFGIDIREATKAETETIGNLHTITLSPVLNTGQIFNDVKEYYQVKLADESIKNLLVYSTQGLDMQGYYL